MSRWVEQAKVLPETFLIEFSNDMAKETVTSTPVDTGVLRGSWYSSINDPSDGPNGRSDPSGSFSIGQISATVSGARLGDKIYLLNSASYARFVEFGTATQRPQAFIRGAINRAEQVAAGTAQRIRRAA